MILTAVGVVGAGIGLGVAFEPARRAPPPKVGAPFPRPLGSPGHEALLPPEALPQGVDTAPAESAVVDFRSRTLSPEPRGQPSALIAISGSRVARIEPDALVVVEPGSPNKDLRFRLPGAFAVAATPLALLAVGTDRLLVLGPGESKPRSMPRPSLFPGSRLVPDLVDAERVWVLHPRSNSLVGYSLPSRESALLLILDTVTLSGSLEGSFLPLADGSLLHFMGAGWEQLVLQGKRVELPWPRTARPFRTLRAHRLDQVFVLSDDGELGLYQLEAPLKRLWHRNVGPLPVDIATSGDTVFLLRTERNQRKELNWTLQVIRRRGPDLVVPLGGTDAGAFEGEWHPRLLARYGLAASPHWVALGGTGQLRVWDAKTLEPVDLGK